MYLRGGQNGNLHKTLVLAVPFVIQILIHDILPILAFGQIMGLSVFVGQHNVSLASLPRSWSVRGWYYLEYTFVVWVYDYTSCVLGLFFDNFITI